MSTSLMYEVDGSFSITLTNNLVWNQIKEWMKISEYLPNKKCCSYKHNCKVDCNCSFKVETLKVSCSIANAEEKKRRKICSQHFIYNFSFQFDLHFYPLMISKPFIYWNSTPKFLLTNYYPLVSHCWAFSISFLSHFYPITIPFIFNSFSISITYLTHIYSISNPHLSHINSFSTPFTSYVYRIFHFCPISIQYLLSSSLVLAILVSDNWLLTSQGQELTL